MFSYPIVSRQDVWERTHSCHYLAGISSLQIQYWGSKVYFQAGVCWPGHLVSLLLSSSPSCVNPPTLCICHPLAPALGHLLHLPPWLWQGHSFEPSTFMLINCPRKWRDWAQILRGNFVDLLKLFNLSWTSPLLTGQFFWPLSQPFCHHSKMPSLLLTALTLVFVKSYLCKIAWWINRNSVNMFHWPHPRLPPSMCLCGGREQVGDSQGSQETQMVCRCLVSIPSMIATLVLHCDRLKLAAEKRK